MCGAASGCLHSMVDNMVGSKAAKSTVVMVIALLRERRPSSCMACTYDMKYETNSKGVPVPSFQCAIIFLRSTEPSSWVSISNNLDCFIASSVSKMLNPLRRHIFICRGALQVQDL